MGLLNMNLLKILQDLLDKKSYNEVAKELNISASTVKRWVELKNVPEAYCFELMKLSKIEIDYKLFSYKQKDQFFSPHETALYCFNISWNLL